MTLSDKSSKLILSTALFTLAGSIVFVSGTGLAQGATTTDKAISTLKKQIKSLQARVQTLEDSPELLQGEPGPEGPQGPQGPQGERGLQGVAGSMSTLKKTTIYYYDGEFNSWCTGGILGKSSMAAVSTYGSKFTVGVCSREVYVP